MCCWCDIVSWCERSLCIILVVLNMRSTYSLRPIHTLVSPIVLNISTIHIAKTNSYISITNSSEHVHYIHSKDQLIQTSLTISPEHCWTQEKVSQEWGVSSNACGLNSILYISWFGVRRYQSRRLSPFELHSLLQHQALSVCMYNPFSAVPPPE